MRHLKQQSLPQIASDPRGFGKENIPVCPHPPYSPIIAPCDPYLSQHNDNNNNNYYNDNNDNNNRAERKRF